MRTQFFQVLSLAAFLAYTPSSVNGVNISSMNTSDAPIEYVNVSPMAIEPPLSFV